MLSPAFRLISICILLASLALAPAASTAAGAPWQARVDPWVLDSASQGPAEFLVFLDQQADLSAASQLKTKAEKGAYVYARLAETAERTQAPLRAALKESSIEYQPFWIANAIWVRGDLQTVEQFARRRDVAHIYANPRVRMALPPVQLDAKSAPTAASAIEWNLTKVNAPQVWAQGYTGQGVVIAGQDTGYDWTHPALQGKYRGWDSLTLTADHNYSWHDAIHSGGGLCGPDAAQPCDDHYHGTHTMGIMVGDDGGGNQVGMAPGAKWIGCRNMDQGVGTPATYIECYQWFIAPTDLSGLNPRPDLAPDVINNSWGCPPTEGCTDPNVMLTVVENVRAAGILTVHSAGNDGYLGCGSVKDPAAIYDASFTVANTTSSDTLASNSSRGPVTIDGSNRLKPDIAAPGSGIRSSFPTRFASIYASLSGTSMAAPHVAGLAALLISAQPALAGQVDELEGIITQSAVHIPVGGSCGGIPGAQYPNNMVGWGRIDAWAALQSHGLRVTLSAEPEWPQTGELLTYTLSLQHLAVITPTHNVVLTDVLPLQTSFISATPPYFLDSGQVRWQFASLDALQQVDLQLVVSIDPLLTQDLVNRFYAARSDEAPLSYGAPLYSLWVHIFPFILNLR
ncbi:MAG: S8 family serine peptidase [Chloroflexota bacterium]